MKQPYLSIVTISRNDEHGGDPKRRTQIFIDSYAWQAEHYKLETELILVDWNTSNDKQGLAEILEFPVNEYFYARVILVPPEVHEGFRYSSTLPIFQFIGKNAGIRRARGEFILATCMDTILDDRLFEYVARKNLNKDYIYRADIYDVNNSIPDAGHEEQQAFCRNPQNEDISRRVHQKYRGLWEKNRINVKDAFSHKADFPWIEFICDKDIIIGKYIAENEQNLNFTACGDFTLMHRETWFELRGHGEFEAYSWNIDSQLLTKAYFCGYTEVDFTPPLSLYHITHGFQETSKSAHITLFIQLDEIAKRNIPILDWESINAINNLLKLNPQTVLNDDRWGLRDIDLAEYVFDTGGKQHLEIKPVPVNFLPLSAIKPEFYMEILGKKEIITVNVVREKHEPSKADKIVNRLRKHRIIWFTLLTSYRVLSKIYRLRYFFMGRKK